MSFQETFSHPCSGGQQPLERSGWAEGATVAPVVSSEPDADYVNIFGKWDMKHQGAEIENIQMQHEMLAFEKEITMWTVSCGMSRFLIIGCVYNEPRCLLKPICEQELGPLCRHQWIEFYYLLYLGSHLRPFWPLNTWAQEPLTEEQNCYSRYCLATGAFGQKNHQVKMCSPCWWQRSCRNPFQKAFQTSEIAPCFSSLVWLI